MYFKVQTKLVRVSHHAFTDSLPTYFLVLNKLTENIAIKILIFCEHNTYGTQLLCVDKLIFRWSYLVLQSSNLICERKWSLFYELWGVLMHIIPLPPNFSFSFNLVSDNSLGLINIIILFSLSFDSIHTFFQV